MAWSIADIQLFLLAMKNNYNREKIEEKCFPDHIWLIITHLILDRFKLWLKIDSWIILTKFENFNFEYVYLFILKILALKIEQKIITIESICIILQNKINSVILCDLQEELFFINFATFWIFKLQGGN